MGIVTFTDKMVSSKEENTFYFALVAVSEIRPR